MWLIYNYILVGKLSCLQYQLLNKVNVTQIIIGDWVSLGRNPFCGKQFLLTN